MWYAVFLERPNECPATTTTDQRMTSLKFNLVRFSNNFTELFEQSLPGSYFQEHGDPQTALGPSSPPVKDGSLMEATLQGPVFS